MIYTNIVRTNEPMKEIQIDRDFEYFKDCQPQYFNYPTTDEEKDKIKQFKMIILIVGEMVKGSKRSNENVLSRSLLFIDFDDVKENEQEFLHKISDKLKEVNYCLYPTLSHITNEKVRYRLVLELDRSVNANDYKTLLFGLSLDLGIKFDLDESNMTWSQGQGGMVVTEKSKDSPTIYQDDKKPIPVDTFLIKIKATKQYKERSKIKLNFTSNYQYTGEKYTGSFLNKIVNGIGEGDRNRWFTSVLGTMFNQGVTAENTYKLAYVINENFLDFPLEDKELITIFKSVMQREIRKRGGKTE